MPALDWEYEAEALREIISSTVSAILALVGIESDPVVGREHILLATIVERSWRAGKDMDLAQLIVQGVKDNVWQLADPSQVKSPVFKAYLDDYQQQVTDLDPDNPQVPFGRQSAKYAFHDEL